MKKQQPAIMFATYGQTHCFRVQSHKDPLQELANTLQNALKHNWDSPVHLASVVSHEKLDTGFKAFDKQTNAISDGNIMANTMFGQYVRPRNLPDSKGVAGGLYAFDIEAFRRRFGDVSQWIEKTLDNLPACETQKVAVYVFFTHSGKTRNTIGAIVVDADRNLITRSTGKTAKHEIVLQAMTEQLTNDGVVNKTLVGQVVEGELVAFMKSVMPYLDAIGCPYKTVE
jgi:hypothetical protein